MKLFKKKALITGGSRGIGEAIALKFAEEGADVAINGRDRATLQKVAQKIEKKGRRALTLIYNVRNVQSLKEMVEKVVGEFGRLDILVNNAGILGNEPFLKVGEEGWDAILDTNLKAVYFLSQFAAGQMIKQKSGTIINIASDIGFRPASSPYAISKWGVAGMTKGLARELGKYGIRVNAVAPGVTATDMTGRKDKPLEQSNYPLGRIATPEDVARATLFLASSDSSHITGHNLLVDGGQSLL